MKTITIIKQAALGAALSLAAWGGSLHASITCVGSDFATGSAWRTPSVLKTNDIDGDNIYGSDGYFLPSAKDFGYRNPLLSGTNVITSDAESINALPAYITGLQFANAEQGSSWGGEFGDDGTMDVVPGSTGLTGAGIMPSANGTNVLNLTLKRNNSPGFRMTLIFGNNPNTLTDFEYNATGNGQIPNNDDPLGVNVTVDDGSGAVSALTGDPSLAGLTSGFTTYQSWDISAGSSDISITIDLNGTTTLIPRLSGVAIDSVPVTAPTVLIPPTSGTVFAGNPVVLDVTAGGAGIGYQWLKNSNSIPGATTWQYQILNSTTNDSGNYQVVITNSAGSITSVVAAVTVLAPPVTVIYADTLSNSPGAPLAGRIPDTTGTSPWIAGSGWLTDGSEAAANEFGNAFLPFTPIPGRIYTLSADMEDFDTTGNNWTALGFANGTDVNDQWHTVNNVVGWFLARGDNTGAANQAFVGPGTANGVAFNYHPTSLSHYQIIFDTTPASPANWTFTYLANGEIYVPPTAFGGSGPTISEVGFGINHYPPDAGDHVKNFLLTEQVPFAAPLIVSQPVGGIHFVGENTSLSVVAGGSDPLTFQWQKNSNSIPTATNSVLVLTNLQTSDAASYRVIVTNPLGTTNSVGASVEVFATTTTILYEDAFSQAGNLNGTIPDTAGTNAWVAGTQWVNSGTESDVSVLYYTSANAFLPFVPQAGNLYTLSATMDCASGGDWMALGFANGTDVVDQWHTVNNPVGWTLVRTDNTGQQNQGFVGPGTSGDNAIPVIPDGPHNYEIILDTRPASPSAWTFTFETDSNNVVGPFAFGASGPTISEVGMGGMNNAVGFVQNFTLTQTSIAPVPSLHISKQGGSVVLSWSASVSGCNLTVASSLGAGASWQPVGGTPTVVNGTNQVTIPISTGGKYFRLVEE